jgi:hypothetical protein
MIFLSMGLSLLVLGLDLLQLLKEPLLVDQTLLDQQLDEGIDLNGIGYQELFEADKVFGVEGLSHWWASFRVHLGFSNRAEINPTVVYIDSLAHKYHHQTAADIDQATGIILYFHSFLEISNNPTQKLLQGIALSRPPTMAPVCPGMCPYWQLGFRK